MCFSILPFVNSMLAVSDWKHLPRYMACEKGALTVRVCLDNGSEHLIDFHGKMEFSDYFDADLTGNGNRSTLAQKNTSKNQH